ncbi:MAG: hypothetical protein Kow0099_33880 [Candidatus Abyssubacteria bacterium]
MNARAATQGYPHDRNPNYGKVSEGSLEARAQKAIPEAGTVSDFFAMERMEIVVSKLHGN